MSELAEERRIAESCDNCETALAGRYCHHCGASPHEASDRTMRTFVADAVRELTSVEQSKLLRTLRALLVKPGYLSLENFSARRVRYLKPLNLFLLIFGLNLIAYAPWTGVSLYDFRTVAEKMKVSDPNSTTIADLKKASARQQVPVERLYERINEDWRQYASLSQVPMALAFALLLAPIFRRRYFVEHLTFSLHFFSFQVLTVVMMWPIYRVVGLDVSAAAFAVSAVKYVIDAVYLYLAAKAFYGTSGARGVARAIATLVAYYAVYLTAHSISMGAALASGLVG